MKLFRRRPFNRTMFIGMVLTAVANVTRVGLERYSSMPENPRDGLVGILFGLAIGSMILGLWQATHPANPADKPRCIWSR